MNRRLRFDTRLRYADRNENAGGKLQRLKPTLELDYRYTKTMQLLFEFGIEWRDYNELSDGEDSKRTTATLGYRWIF